MSTTFQRIDEPRLESDVAYRFGYVSGFIGFGEADIAALHEAAPHLLPLVPAIVDAVYVKLFSYDATKRHFLPRQFGYDGALPQDIEHLALDHDQIAFRKQHLARYLVKLMGSPFNEQLVGYLDWVGKIHTPKAGSPEIAVPLVQMNSLMGFVSDALTGILQGLPIPQASRDAAVRAFGKLLWIQNDLISRHYVPDPAKG